MPPNGRNLALILQFVVIYFYRDLLLPSLLLPSRGYRLILGKGPAEPPPGPPGPPPLQPGPPGGGPGGGSDGPGSGSAGPGGGGELTACRYLPKSLHTGLPVTYSCRYLGTTRSR